MKLSLQVFDDGLASQPIVTYSSLKNLNVRLIDPCLAQQITLKPLFANEDSLENIQVNYEILQGQTVYRFSVEPLLPKCPLILALTPTCMGKACDSIEASLDENGSNLTVMANVGKKS